MMPPREIRLLRELIAYEKITVGDLRQNVGAVNPAQVKFQLTRRSWVIQTGFITVLDRDNLDRATLPALPANDVSEQRETTTTNDHNTGGGK